MGGRTGENQLSPSRKRYMEGKNIYDYIRGAFANPQKNFNKLEPYFGEDFQANMIEDTDKITLIYTLFKRKNQETTVPS